MPLPPAALISAGVAWIAWRAHTLTRLGAVAGWMIGTLALYGTGWAGGAVLAAFFVSSNLVSRIGPVAPAPHLDAKGDRRDLWQVCANGGPAAIGAVIAHDIQLATWIVTASLAAAAADTWATSLGVRSELPPRLVWSARVVPAGTSGGVTLMGSAGALLGAMIVSGIGSLAAGIPLLLPVGTLIGFAGMLVDSVVGGVMQGRFYCPACDQASEWRVHRCGCATERRGGLAWLNNDVVNFVATTFAAGAGAVAWFWLSRPE